jgi:hypothetical protein
MQRLTSFLLGCVVGGILVTMALKFHVVRAASGWHFVPKVQAEFAGTYVDIRSFGFQQWQEHPQLALAIGRAGKQELLGEAAQQAARDSMSRLWSELQP